MASSFDVVFAFKQVFNDVITADIISGLRCHPAIWRFISEENNYLRIARILGNNHVNWNAHEIIDAVRSNGRESEDFSLSAEMQDVIDSIVLINSQIASDNWKTVILRIFENEILDSINSTARWGTVFSYFFSREQNPKEIIHTLMQISPKGAQIIAFLIKTRIIANDHAFLAEFIKTHSLWPAQILEIYEQLVIIDSSDHAEDLIKTYFRYIDNLENRDNSVVETQSLDFSLEIQRLLELSGLAGLIQDDQREEFYSSEASKLMRTFSNNIVKLNTSDFLLLEKAKNLGDIDKEHSRAMYLEWIELNENPSGLQSIARLPIHKIQEIISDFLSVGLHIPIILFTERILTFTGRKPELEKLIGDVCDDYGDQARVIKYFLPLNGEGSLSRQQKIKLTNAFVYYEDWKSADLIFNSVNLLTTADNLFSLLCKLKANPKFDLDQFIANLTAEKPNIDAYIILKRIMGDEKIEISELSKFSNDESKLILWIIYHHLINGEKTKLLSFLAEIKEISPYSKYLYTKHFSELLPFSEVNTLYSSLLNAEDIDDQKLYENIIEDLMEKELDLQLEMNLNKNSWKWPLSRVNYYSIIKKQLNDQNYTQAKSDLEWAIPYFSPDNTMVTLYGTYLLRTTLTELPFSRQACQISDEETQKFQSLIDHISDQELSVINQILKIEILSNKKTNDYLEIGTTEFKNEPLNSWRVLHALGNHFFHLKKYDQAIIYLTESRKFYRKSDSSFHMLLTSHIQLKMYDEAAHLIQLESNAGTAISYELLRKLSQELYENDRFFQFLTDGEVNEPVNINKTLAFARVLMLRGSEFQALEILNQLEERISQRDATMIDLAGIYHEAGDGVSSKRVLDTYLSNKQDLNDRDLVLSAGLFFNLGLYEKSLNVLTLIDDQKINADFARSSIHLELGEVNLASQAFLQGTLRPDRKKFTKIVDQSSLPKSWISVDGTLLEGIVIDLINGGDVDQLSNFITYLKNQAEEGDVNSIRLICNTAQLTGDFNYLDGFYPDRQNNQSFIILPVRLARITRGLIEEHEIEAALLISEVDRAKSDSPLLDLLEIRLQLRQIRESEIVDRINTIFDQVIEGKNGLWVENESNLEALVFQLNLSEALNECRQFIKAYALLKNIIKTIGFTPRIAVCYREIIEKVLTEKKINELLLIKNHDLRLDDEDEEILTLYMATIQDDDGLLALNEEIPSKHLLSQCDNLDHLTNSVSDTNLIVDNDLICLITFLNEKPNEVIECLTRLLKNDGNNPRLLFALGLAYRQINDYVKSYAPIRLALEIWPEEYSWHEIAADLCEKNGDNLNAARHRGLMQQYSGLFNENITDYYQNIHQIINESVFGDKDVPGRHLTSLLNYSADLTSWNCEDIAEKVVCRILEISPKNLRAQKLNIEISLKQKNFSKAKGLLSQLLSEYPEDLKIIELQVQYLMDIGELHTANDFISDYISKKGFLDSETPFLMVELLEKQDGIEKALVFINNQIERSNDISFNQKAITYLINKNQIQQAQSILNQLLQIDSNDTESLFIAGKLAEAKGDLDQALAYYNRAITINPFIGKLYIACADLYDTRRQFVLAQKMLDEGVRHNPNDFPLLKYAGIYLKKVAKEQSYVECLRRAYTINRYDKEIESILKSKEG
jgi:hypothetical protein